MTKFTNVIVRKPGKSLCNGITSAPELGQPIYERAVEEHDDYIAALKQCGVEVTELPALEEYPDSCFVEDPAVITRCGAIITNPGADSRNGEKDEIEPTIRQFFDDEHVKHIVAPGTLDGGDVMMVGDHFYVGRSARTNEEGIRQFIEILEGWGLEGSEVPLEEVLHLKTGVNYLEDGNMLVSGEFIEKPDFAQYNKVVVPEDEAYGANCIWVNGTVIVPEGYPTVLKAVQGRSATRRWWWTPPSTARWTAACPACRCASKPAIHRMSEEARDHSRASLCASSTSSPFFGEDDSFAPTARPRATPPCRRPGPRRGRRWRCSAGCTGAGACSRQAGAA